MLDKCLTGKVIKDQRIALVLKGTCWEGAVKRANLVIEIPEINPSVYTYVYISCKIQNIVYITHIANTRHQKRKDKVKRD